MTRTTIDLDPSVLEGLRRRSAADRKSIGRVASELLATAMAGADEDRDPPRFAWRSGNLGTPRIDLEDKEALRRALDAG